MFIAESSAGYTTEGFEQLRVPQALDDEHKKLNVKLVDLNEEGSYEMIQVLNGDLHITPVRLAQATAGSGRLRHLGAMLKTHNTVIATMNIKNMALGAPLH